MTYVGGKRWSAAVRSCAVEVGDGGKCAQASYRGSGLREEKLVYPDNTPSSRFDDPAKHIKRGVDDSKLVTRRWDASSQRACVVENDCLHP